MSAIQQAAALARQFEGLYLRPYLCPAGVPTIGYGATCYEDGSKVRLTDPPITRERAEALLIFTISRQYMPAVLKLCPGVTSAEQIAALTDWTFNLGVGALRTSTMRKRVNAGEWAAAAIEMLRWNKAGGRVLPGLVRRRQAEVRLLLA